jgi:GNAT superfamily N-acetyltransferase
MESPDIRPISAAETRPLRQRILRPHQTLAELVHAGDDAPDTLHVGAFIGAQLVGVASIHREAPPGAVGEMWRLRGMAVEASERRRGCGRALVAACLAHATRHGGTVVWCNARIGALAFYQSLGFSISGNPFELPKIGVHYFMSRSLARASVTAGERW